MNYYVIGDVLEDIYYLCDVTYDNQLLVNQTIKCPGGAGNTYSNLCSLLKNRDSCSVQIYNQVTQQFGPLSVAGPIGRYHRYIDSSTGNKIDERKVLPKGLSYFDCRALPRMLGTSVLVASDYNKGCLQKIQHHPSLSRFRLGIFDSKYHSIDKSLIECCETSVLHCTGEEFNLDFASLFTYVVWSDAEKPVRILDNTTTNRTTLVVPPVKVNNTCGAGDTMTATLAAWLGLSDQVGFNDVVSATRSAIVCCAEVVGLPYTDITTYRI